MKVENVKRERLLGKDHYCPHFLGGYVECYPPRHCSRCDFADRIRYDTAEKNKAELLFTGKDVLRQTEKGGGADWWHFPIILTEEAMDRLHIEKNLYYQIAIADGGPGVFLKNRFGYLDIHLLADPRKKYVISRGDAYGIPTAKAVRRYDSLFFMDLHKVINNANASKGVWCL